MHGDAGGKHVRQHGAVACYGPSSRLSTIGRRVFVVTDRGMISAATIAALKKRGLECILSTRDHCDVRVCEIVLESDYHSRRF